MSAGWLADYSVDSENMPEHKDYLLNIDGRLGVSSMPVPSQFRKALKEMSHL